MEGESGTAAGAPEGVWFELDRCELNDKQHRIEVSGRWFGVRGRRFVRPSLTLVGEDAGRRSLADLEHKPWSADDGQPWLAAFPWDGEGREVRELELAVAPDIAVALPPPGARAQRNSRRSKTQSGRSPRRAAEREPARRAGKREPKADGGKLGAELARVVAERDAAAAARDAAVAARDAAVAARNELARERDGLERQLAQLAEERNGLVAERSQLSSERNAARTLQDRLTRERDAALSQNESLTQACAALQRERDAARAGQVEAVRDQDAVRHHAEVRVGEAEVELERSRAELGRTQWELGQAQWELGEAQRDLEQSQVVAPGPAPAVTPDPGQREMVFSHPPILTRGGTRRDIDWVRRGIALAVLLVVVIALLVVLRAA